MGKMFATMLIVLQAAAAIGYCFPLDVRKAAYWAAAAVLTTAVTY